MGMSELPVARMRNMDARRQRILDEAGKMLGAGGVEGLTLRGLAAAACVTVPTIYNLVGCKERVVAALIAGALDELEQVQTKLPALRGMARAEQAVRASTALFFGDPARYGAVFRVLQELQHQPGEQEALGALFRRAGDVYCHSVVEAQVDGDLHGRLLPVPLGHHILHAQIENFRLWGVGSLPAPAVQARAFYAIYVSLMADATKQGRKWLLDRLRENERLLDN